MTLTPDELREHVQTSLGDDALQRLIDAAEAAIVSRAGPAGARTELVFGGYRTVALSKQAASVALVTERISNTLLTLDATDYRIRPDRYTLERIATGVNPRWRWWGQVEITYTPADDDALRTGVEIDLCRLAIDYYPGLTAETIGAYSVQYGANSVWNNLAEYETILARLNPEPSMMVVGEPAWGSTW